MKSRYISVLLSFPEPGENLVKLKMHKNQMRIQIYFGHFVKGVHVVKLKMYKNQMRIQIYFGPIVEGVHVVKLKMYKNYFLR